MSARPVNRLLAAVAEDAAALRLALAAMTAERDSLKAQAAALAGALDDMLSDDRNEQTSENAFATLAAYRGTK